MNGRPKTIILDIDGCCVRHLGDITAQHLYFSSDDRFLNNPPLHDFILPGVIDKLKQWDLKGYRIILLTGRRESTRKATEEQLSKLGIIYDQLVMGVTGGERVLINDNKPDGTLTASVVNLKRNEGLTNANV